MMETVENVKKKSGELSASLSNIDDRKVAVSESITFISKMSVGSARESKVEEVETVAQSINEDLRKLHKNLYHKDKNCPFW